MHKSWLGPALAILVAALLSIFLARTSLSLKENSLNSNSPSAWASVDVPLKRPEAAVDRFAGVLKFRTISSKTKENHVVYPEDFRGLHKYFRKQWPLVFKQLQVNTVNEHSLLFKWQGSDPSLKPVLCISHQDVVAVGSESRWTYPAFSGKVADGYIWGRGALDLKFTAAALLEAVSHLLDKGHVPLRTVYLAFGHDEEVSGGFGAAAMAQMLEKQGIEFEHIFDEGGSILVDGIKGLLDKPLGLVGTAEKATQNMEIEVHGKGGHTMAPPHDGSSVVARVARLVNKIETSFPAPKLQAPTSDLLKTVGGVVSNKLLGFLLRNCETWPLSWIVAQLLARKDPELGSTLRTTGVTTDIQFLPPGRNVIPSVATAHLSYRLLPYDKPERIHKQLESFAAAESGAGEVKVSKLEFVKLSPVSSTNSLGFQLIKRAAMETLRGPEGLVVAPYLMLGRTDSTHYSHLSSGNIFRFMPFTLNRTAGDLQRVHGIDERVGTETYLNGVKFYIRYFQLLNDPAQS